MSPVLCDVTAERLWLSAGERPRSPAPADGHLRAPGFGAGRTLRLFVTTPTGDELEIVVPEGVESEEEFDVDMADVSDEDEVRPSIS